MVDVEGEELLAALGVEPVALKSSSHTPQEERLIAGFEDILRFVQEQGRMPSHGEDRDIFERLYAVRLERLRGLTSAHALLAPWDSIGLLSVPASDGRPGSRGELSDTDLLAELGLDDDSDDITQLTHVRSYEERRAADEIATRQRCEDFERFKPLFERIEGDLEMGLRRTLRFGRDGSVEPGNFFILGGQMAYVAEMGRAVRTPNGESNARLRVIYSNGTESDLLQRSLQRALYKDKTGRRITDDEAGPLFGDTLEPDDIVNGTIYVLRSLSDHPYVAEHRELIHKIGVTSGAVEARVAKAERDPTYMLARVEVVATYKLSNLNRMRLENIFHRIFQSARLDLTIFDRLGAPIRPREWFMVPLFVIDEAVRRIKDGSITNYTYEPESARLVPKL
ncbi:GIY-YIG nuclease family protein [Stenotrophomonas maltophilia]|uniref:GIY-YIG nuclease family protein n=1 Tax=Stenotrophomonas maltophilia TaxID=40324 RepID=UPI0013DC3698|nr:GIY-YIG nuclease family protein [Stenotrophomonas maltophilia]